MKQLCKYELLVLTSPEITQDETKELEKQVSTLVKDRKGSIVSFERWGKYRLAYPVKKHDYGVYFLARFDVPTAEKLNLDIHSLFRIKFDGVVMREMLTVLEDNTSAYKRPRSLEDTPKNDATSLLKNKKVEGLISAADATRSTKKAAKSVTDNVAKTEKGVAVEPKGTKESTDAPSSDDANVMTDRSADKPKTGE